MVLALGSTPDNWQLHGGKLYLLYIYYSLFLLMKPNYMVLWVCLCVCVCYLDGSEHSHMDIFILV